MGVEILPCTFETWGGNPLYDTTSLVVRVNFVPCFDFFAPSCSELLFTFLAFAVLLKAIAIQAYFWCISVSETVFELRLPPL
jgi:hypothetical protein